MSGYIILIYLLMKKDCQQSFFMFFDPHFQYWVSHAVPHTASQSELPGPLKLPNTPTLMGPSLLGFRAFVGLCSIKFVIIF